MSAPRKYDQEFRERAVRMYRERLAEPGESKRGARRHVGVLLDVNPETLRNWADERDRVESGRSPAPRSAESEEEVRALRRRVAELERANEILKSAFLRGGARPPTPIIVDPVLAAHRGEYGVETPDPKSGQVLRGVAAGSRSPNAWVSS